MDWGTTIVDAGGSFHDIAKSAFDGIHKEGGQFIDATQSILNQDFSKTYQRLLAKTKKTLGLNAEDELSLENMQSQVGSKIKHHIARIGVEAIADGVLNIATDLEGPLGLLIGEAVNLGIEAFREFISDSYNYKPGEWVFIDMGERPRRPNDRDLVQIKTEQSIFSPEAFFSVPDEVEYSMVPHHVIGFIMGQGEKSGDWVVFNFESGDEEPRRSDEIRPCPQELKDKMDKSDDFSLVREVKFLKDHDPTLKSYLPTEAGQEVFFEKKSYIVVEREGDNFVIEGKNGKRLKVTTSELTGGRVSNTASWDRDSLHLGSFTSRSPDALFVGEWVWVPAQDLMRGRRLAHGVSRESKVLALVDYIQEDNVHFTRAYDGKQSQLKINQVYGVKSEVVGVLNGNTAAKQFKQRVLHNNETKSHPLGKALPLLTLGKGPPGLTDPEKMNPHMKFKNESPREVGDVEILPGNADKAIAKEARNKEEYDMEDRPYDTYAVQPAEGGSEGGSFTVVVGAAILIALVFATSS